MKKSELKLLWPFYLTALTSSSISVALPVWIIYFHKQFSFMQISFAISLQAMAIILFEIPTGAVADVLGRKPSVVLGILLQGLLWLTLPFVHGEYALYAAFFTMGILRTMESGADQAWIVDWLKHNHRGNLVRDMLVKIHSLRSAGLVAGSALATLMLICFDIRILFFVQGCGHILESLILFVFAEENSNGRKRKSLPHLAQDAAKTTQQGFDFLLGSKQLLYLVFATTLAASTRNFGCLAWQPVLVGFSVPVAQLGAIFAVASVAGIVAPFLTRMVLSKYHCEKQYLSVVTLMEFTLLASLLLVGTSSFGLGVLIFILVSLLSDMQSPISSFLFQSAIPSRMRSTLSSAQSVIISGSSLVFTLIGGYIMDNKGPREAMIYLSVLLLPASFMYLKAQMKMRSSSHPPQFGYSKT